MGADTVIDISNEIWELYTFNATKGVLKSMAKLPLATDADHIAWQRPSLGYDGVILDQKGDLFLASLPLTAIEGETQALSLMGSNEKLTLVGTKYPGGGMLFFKKRSGNAAILQSITTKDGAKYEIKPGAKLIIESVKK